MVTHRTGELRIVHQDAPEVILDAGKQLGVDMTPVDRFVALDNEPTDEETACMIVNVKVCWDQCEVSLRDGRYSEDQETFDQTAWTRARCWQAVMPQFWLRHSRKPR